MVRYTAKKEDDDVGQIFIAKLEEIVKQIYHQFKFPKEMIYTKKDKKDFEAATVCHICGYNLRRKCGDNFIEDRVRDHCHLTGKFRGAAHNECNLGYKIPNFIPVFFHNLWV